MPDRTAQARVVSFAPIDYALVKRDLKDAPAEPRTILLQALRWRLTKSKSRARQEVLTGYIHHDIFDLASGEQISNSMVIGAVLSHETEMVREYGARLLNVMTSDAAGRAYILLCGGLP